MEDVNQFTINVDMKHPPAMTNKQEDVTIHQCNVDIPNVIQPSKTSADISVIWLCTNDPKPVFVVVQHPYIDNILAPVSVIDAKCDIHR